ncbi:MAG: hypothetical protein Q9185_003404 [Variospora sp. 1 TL-2023]
MAAHHQPSRGPNPLARPLNEKFPIEKLAPQRQQPVYQPPTPPPEEDNDSTMEWTPQHQFGPPLTYRAPQTRRVFDEPSPFHGVIPAAPVSWAQRLRNPPNQPAFHKASEEKKENFFSKKSRPIVSDTASEVSSVAPSVADTSMFEVDSPVKLAPPRFFAPVDRMETGLESLFGDTFSLVLVRMISVQSDGGKEADQVAALGLWFLIAMTVQEVWGFIFCLAAPSAATAIESPARPPIQETQTLSNPRPPPASAYPKASKAKAPAASAPTATSTKANPIRVEVSQRTTRSKARNEVRRDSVGVDGLGGLSLGGW